MDKNNTYQSKIGARILNIITESLYDEPIVVFREYTQNAVDSIQRKSNISDGVLKIWSSNNSLFFLDNGEGIDKDLFYKKMVNIGLSGKTPERDIGYKGIGRLSGMAYCKELIFINVLDFFNRDFQTYTIDCLQYAVLKKKPEFNSFYYDDVIKKICDYRASVDEIDAEKIVRMIGDNNDIFNSDNNTGFFVVLKDVSVLLKSIYTNTNKNKIIEELGWRLPVDFSEDFIEKNLGLVQEFSQQDDPNAWFLKTYKIFYNNTAIKRPLSNAMLREYTSVKKLKYAKGFLSFSNKQFTIQSNKLTGIRVYYDNMLLCDERELVASLQKYGYIEHTSNEWIQSLRSVGGIIYIFDKLNISVNARRTFIEVQDEDSIDLLAEVAVMLESIFKTRYALSRYYSALKTNKDQENKIENLKQTANECLRELASDEIAVTYDQQVSGDNFDDLDIVEQKKYIKKIIKGRLNEELSSYLNQTTELSSETAYEDFLIWLKNH